MLTVPKAGTIAGRAPQVTVAQPETGGVLAEFGNRMLEHGLNWKAEQRKQQIAKNKLDITRDYGAARLEVEQIGDPAQIGPAWDAKVAEITGKYITADTDPEVAAALKLSMQELGDKHALELAEKSINLDRSAQEAGWLDMRQSITTEAASADPTTFKALIDLGEAAIDDRAAKGLIDPATAAAEKIKLREEVYAARALTAISTDPEGFLAAAEAGDYKPLGAEGLAKAKLDAQGEIARRDAAAAKAAEAETKARDDAIGARLDAIASGAEKGRVVVDEAELSNPEVMAHPKWPKAKAMVELRKENASLDVMTPAQLDALIKAEESRPIAEPWENERLTVLRAMRDAKAAAYAADAKAAAAASGLPAPDLPDFDPAAPQDWAAALAKSLSFDAWLRGAGYTDRPAVFTTEQKAKVKAILDPKADAAPKVALLSAILSGAVDKAGQVLSELEADPVARRSLKLLGLTRDTALTEAVLRGQQKIEAKTVILPSRKEQILAFDAMTGGIFDDAPSIKEEIMAAAAALYADSAAGIDGETTGSDGWVVDGEAFTLYQQSVQRILGARPDANGKLTFGGIQEVNGALVALPPTVSGPAADAALDRLGASLSYRYGVPVGGATDAVRAARMAPLKTASLYGGTPDFGADPGALWSSLTLHRVGDSDIYEFRYDDGSGRLTPVPQTDGRTYRFRLSDLIREAGQ